MTNLLLTREGCLERQCRLRAQLAEQNLWAAMVIDPHESPRLNNAWDDTLQEGDVFACEPGLYGAELKTGIRIEDDFVVSETGVEELSNLSREI